VGAATVLQRAWRKVLNTRIERLLVDIIAVQTMGRGWIAREKVRGGGVVKLRRVIGGW
jgi:abnormal spindle-like microcephaly-associated protein